MPAVAAAAIVDYLVVESLALFGIEIAHRDMYKDDSNEIKELAVSLDSFV